MEVPALYAVRPARLEDAEAVAEVANANALAMVGELFTSADELRSEWSMPGRDLDRTSRVVHGADGTLAAMAFVEALEPFSQPFAWGEVVPAHRGRGLGSVLADWAEEQARAFVRQAPPEAETALHWGVWKGEAGLSQLLAERGFACVRHFWRMDVDLAEPPPAPAWPPGIEVRTFVRDADERRTYDAVQEAFDDHWGEHRLSFEQWRHERIEAAGERFDPSLWFLALDGDELAGMSICQPTARYGAELGYVAALGVRRAWRRQGLARALLLHSFAAFRERGRAGVSLHVDAANPTGALALYEGVGMVPLPRFEIWEKPLPR
jgi:mycothiol synthase